MRIFKSIQHQTYHANHKQAGGSIVLQTIHNTRKKCYKEEHLILKTSLKSCFFFVRLFCLRLAFCSRFCIMYQYVKKKQNSLPQPFSAHVNQMNFSVWWLFFPTLITEEHILLCPLKMQKSNANTFKISMAYLFHRKKCLQQSNCEKRNANKCHSVMHHHHLRLLCTYIGFVIQYSFSKQAQDQKQFVFLKTNQRQKSLETIDIFLLCLYSSRRTLKIIIQTNLKLQKWYSIHSISFVI